MGSFKSISRLIVIILISGCSPSNEVSKELTMFEDYFKAATNDNEDRWIYTTDTVKVWFDEKEGDPVLRIKDQGSTGPWKEWDDEMHATSYYDSIWFDKDQQAINGFFYENNDFYKLIGKQPTITLRTYWLNSDNKIHEVLIYWIPEENTTTGEHLIPVVKWAMMNDSLEIMELYPDEKIIPSSKNALRWKQLLERYNEYSNAQ